MGRPDENGESDEHERREAELTRGPVLHSFSLGAPVTRLERQLRSGYRPFACASVREYTLKGRSRIGPGR